MTGGREDPPTQGQSDEDPQASLDRLGPVAKVGGILFFVGVVIAGLGWSIVKHPKSYLGPEIGVVSYHRGWRLITVGIVVALGGGFMTHLATIRAKRRESGE